MCKMRKEHWVVLIECIPAPGICTAVCTTEEEFREVMRETVSIKKQELVRVLHYTPDDGYNLIYERNPEPEPKKVFYVCYSTYDVFEKSLTKHRVPIVSNTTFNAVKQVVKLLEELYETQYDMKTMTIKTPYGYVSDIHAE